MSVRPSLWRFIPILAFLLAAPPLCLQANAQTGHYQLLEGSTFLDDCAFCDRLSISYPMRGEFDLLPLAENTLLSRYALTNLQFVAGPSGQPVFKLTGGGVLEIGGEVALLQKWMLQLRITPHVSTNTIVLTNSTKTLDRFLPNLSVSCVQSNGTLDSTVYLEIKAAPLEEIWLLARKPVQTFQPGDILSTRGRLVKSLAELLAPLGITNPPPGLTLDALDIRTGYRFSLSGAIPDALDPIRDGDLLSGASKILPVERWMSAFGLPKTTPDPGFDAVHFLDWGDTLPVDLLFSIRQPVFSPKLNRTLGRGDLLAYTYGSLSGDPAVRRTNAELLAQFHPPAPKHDYGLDGVYLWRHGEIWFSLEEGFTDAQLGPISEGDLLSDAGFIVFRNADLLRNFSVDLKTDFGLSDFFIVTDAGYPATQWLLNPPHLDAATGHVTLSWRPSLAPGTVVQLQRAPHLGLPFEPVSPIITETQWTDPGVLKTNRTAIYKLRDWH
jgi:hypothetical protein